MRVVILCIIIGMWATESGASELSRFSHSRQYYENDNYIILQVNYKLQDKAKLKRCGGFPIQRDCDHEEITYSRHSEVDDRYFSSAIFIQTIAPYKLTVANCDIRISSCLSSIKAGLGITGQSTKHALRIKVADIDGDKNKDILITTASLSKKNQSFVILSTPGLQGLRTQPVLNQVIGENLFGVSLDHVKRIELRDKNNDQKADLLVTLYGGNKKIVAYADSDAKFSRSQEFIAVANELPTEFNECSKNIIHPNSADPLAIKFSADCTTAFMPPPSAGIATVSKVDKKYNLDFCPIMKGTSVEVQALSTQLDGLAQKLLNLAESLTQDATTTSLQQQINSAKLATALVLDTYKAKLAIKAALQERLVLAEFDLDLCRFIGGTCDLGFSAIASLKQNIAVADLVVDVALAEYMKAQDTKEALILALGQYRSNILQTLADYQLLMAEYAVLIQLKTGLYKELSELEGATVRFQYQLNLADQILKYQNLNAALSINWRYLPVSAVELLTDLEGINGVGGSPVLWMTSEDKSIDYRIFPDGNSLVNASQIAQNTIQLLDRSFVDIGLGLVGACRFYLNSKTATNLDINTLTALTPVKIEYTYKTAVRRDYTVRYNLYLLAKSFFERSLYQKVINKLSVTNKQELAQSLQKLENLSNTDIAELLDSRFDSQWLQLNFSADTSGRSYSLLEQEEIRMEVKSRLLKKLLKEVGMLYRKNRVYQKSTYAYSPAQKPLVMDACWTRYGALCRFSHTKIHLSSQVFTNFRNRNDIWQTDKIVDSEAVERTAGTTFMSNSDSSVFIPPPTISAPTLKPVVPANPQATVYDANGNIIAVYDTTSFIGYEYDGLGRIIKERRYSDSPASPLWSENFLSAPQGLTDIPQNYMQVRAGQLIVTSLNTANEEWPEVRGLRNYSLAEKVLFRFEVTTGSSPNGRYLVVGVDGDWTMPAYRRHAILFDGNSVFVSYYDAGYKTQWLDFINNNTSYIVEVQSDLQGTTVYWYEKGLDRTQGYSDRKNYSDWGQLQTFIEAKGAPGLVSASMSIENVAELKSGTNIGGVNAKISNLDIVKEYFYNDLGQLIGYKDVSGAVVSYQYNNSSQAISQKLHHIKPLPSLWVQHFDRNANGFWQLPQAFMSLSNGRLVVSSSISTNWQWPSAVGRRSYIQDDAIVMRAQITTGSQQNGRYLVIGLEGDNSTTNQSTRFRRHAAYFNGDSVFAAYFDGGHQDVWLGLIKPDQTYVVELKTTPSSTTLSIFEQGQDRTLGYSDTRFYSDWGKLSTYVEAQGNPNNSGAKMFVNYVSESKYQGELMGSYIVQNSANDILSSVSVQP